MNIRTGRKFALVALLAALALPMAAVADGSRPGGSHGGSGGSGGYRELRAVTPVDTAATAVPTVATAGTTAVTAATTAATGSAVGWYGYPGWGGYYGGYGGYGYYGAPGWGYTSVYPAVGATHGALDLDVSPESAQIYVDGQLVGIADDFDGFPDFLWLEKGTYDVAIFAPGFQTLARQYSVYGGMVIDIEDAHGARSGDAAGESGVEADREPGRTIAARSRERRAGPRL